MLIKIPDEKTDLKSSLECFDNDLSRLRKDRDQMRELYEKVNYQLIASNKSLTQMSSLIASLEKRNTILEIEIKKSRKMIDDASANQVETNELFSELDSLGKAFDELQAQNVILINQTQEKDDMNAKMLAEKLKSEFAIIQIKKDLEFSLKKATILEKVSLERMDSAEKLEQKLIMQIHDCESKLLNLTVEYEKSRISLSMISSENGELRLHIQKLSTNNQNSDSLPYEYIAENKRLKIDLEAAQRKLNAYAESGIVATKEQEDELAIYKKLMKCNSCHIRDKNAVISKCMHVFCKQCLDTRVETRQRKCPNCAEPFGANDIRLLYL